MNIVELNKNEISSVSGVGLITTAFQFAGGIIGILVLVKNDHRHGVAMLVVEGALLLAGTLGGNYIGRRIGNYFC